MIALLVLAYLVASVYTARAFARAIRLADQREGTSDETWLDDQPAAVLSDAEIRRRIRQIDVLL